MMISRLSFWSALSVAAFAVGLGGCNQGYKSAATLDAEDRGPASCSASCREIGMQMSAFVIVDQAATGCVCAPAAQYAPPPHVGPEPAPGAAAPTGEAAGSAAAYVAVLQRQQAEERRRQAQQAQQK